MKNKGHRAPGRLSFRAASGRLLAAAMACGLVGALDVAPAWSDTLEQALAQAYSTNPTLGAQRASVRATDETVAFARSDYRPRVDATASAGLSRSVTESTGGTASLTSDPNGTAGVTALSKSVGVQVTQPIYRGGRTVAGVSAAENRVQAARANLLDIEQQVLLAASQSYMDVVRDQAVLRLNVNNEQVLRRQLEAAQDRFRVGEITRTDVSQAESRLARATAQRIQAEGQLSASRSAFTRIVGMAPGDLKAPKITFKLPKNQDEAVEFASNSNPNVITAAYSEKAARDDVDVVNGQRLPEVNLSAAANRSWRDIRSQQSPSGARSPDTDGVDGSLRAQVNIPLYTGGGVEARVREAKQTANQRRIQIEEARRRVVDAAVRAWQGLQTARASIESRRSQVRSSEIALEGVRQEATVGSRTVLDTLDAEQELLDARVGLVTAEREEVVAAFNVLQAIGQLTARQLGLPVEYYDYEAHYNDVRGKWWGTSVD